MRAVVWKGRMKVQGKDGSGRELWKCKGSMEGQRKDGRAKEGWKWKRIMEVQGKDDGRRCQQPPEDQGSTNEKKKYIKSQS